MKVIICKACGEHREHKAHGLCQKCYCKKWNKENQEYIKKYYIKNKDRINARNRKYHLRNKEKGKARNRKYRLENPEKGRARQKKWAKNNPEKAKNLTIKWRRANPEKAREYRHKRRVGGIIKKGTISKLLNENIFKYGIITCEKCKQECEDSYNIDHIIPVNKQGTNEYKNLQILCPHCNRSKWVNTIDYKNISNEKQLFLR